MGRVKPWVVVTWELLLFECTTATSTLTCGISRVFLFALRVVLVGSSSDVPTVEHMIPEPKVGTLSFI